MPKVSPIQSNFSGGEFTPRMGGRVDAERYKTGLAVCLNYLPTIQGALVRRSGTYYGASTKVASGPARLEPFVFGTTQAYMLEFGNLYIRFYKDDAIITSSTTSITAVLNSSPMRITIPAHGLTASDRVLLANVGGIPELNNREFAIGVPDANNIYLYDKDTVANIDGSSLGAFASGGTVSKIYEIATLFASADLFQLKFTQSDDVLYVVHPSYAPAKIARTSHTSWTLRAMSFVDGPYLELNSVGTAFTMGATTGPTTLTASAVTGINGDTGFKVTDIARKIRVFDGTHWFAMTVTGFTSTTVVTVTFSNTMSSTGSFGIWRLGLWSDTTGYPGCVTFHEDRLCFSGSPAKAQRVDGSVPGDYETFTPSDSTGTVADDDAYAIVMNSNQVNATRWLMSDEKGLLPGSVGGEWFIKPASNEAGITANKADVKNSTTFGAADIQALKCGRATLYVQRSGKKLRELSYNFYVDGFESTDMTILSQHITGEGLIQLAYQQEPLSTIWAVRADGALLSMTYERDSQSVKAGWARHVVGGVSDSAGSDAIVESVATIPSSDGTHDEVWIVVKRWINGATARSVERFAPEFDELSEQQDALFLDSALTYDVPITMVDATVAGAHPITISTAFTAHGLVNGDQVRFTGVKGLLINDETFTVASATTYTFDLAGIAGAGRGSYISGGEIRKLVSTVTGLAHLEGETVSILGDGAVIAPVVVTNGAVALATPASVVQIGLPYNSDAQQLRLDAGAADGTAVGKIRRTHRVGFLVHRTLGLRFGMNFDSMNEVVFRTAADEMGKAIPLYSGIVSELIESDYDYENQICWRQSDPLPGMILAVLPQYVEQDRG